MTLVVDAAVVVEVLLGTRRGGKAAALLGGHDLLAPQHLTAEVASVFRACLWADISLRSKLYEGSRSSGNWEWSSFPWMIFSQRCGRSATI